MRTCDQKPCENSHRSEHDQQPANNALKRLQWAQIQRYNKHDIANKVQDEQCRKGYGKRCQDRGAS